MSHVISTLGQDWRQLLEGREKLESDMRLPTGLCCKKQNKFLFSVNLHLLRLVRGAKVPL